MSESPNVFFFSNSDPGGGLRAAAGRDDLLEGEDMGPPADHKLKGLKVRQLIR
jgi:hypothetical protein